MISVLIPTLDSERHLVPALSALVPGSVEGLIREVILADGGSRDETAKIADAAGCEFLACPADRSERVVTAARAARGEWLLILDPASVLEDGWTREVRRFIEDSKRHAHAAPRSAAFRLTFDGAGVAPRVREFAAAARLALTGRARPEQGLLIEKQLYQSNGGKPGRVVRLRTRVTIPA
jgi:hypothetical protein